MTAFQDEPALPSRIAVLHAEGDRTGERGYLVELLSDVWEGQGIEVVHLNGTRQRVPADLLFMHVDRTIVPHSYRRFARHYPMALNASAHDISKRQFIDGLVMPGSGYGGPVIVKSNLNYAGRPELRAAKRTPSIVGRLHNLFVRRWFKKSGPAIKRKEDYRVYPSLDDVPSFFRTKDCVIQEFRTEMIDGRYLLREYYFLGDAHFQSVEASGSPVFTEDESLEVTRFDPPEQLLLIRRQLSLDYGKLDYVLLDGQPFVFDANRALGLGRMAVKQYGKGQHPKLTEGERLLVEGLADALLDWYAGQRAGGVPPRAS